MKTHVQMFLPFFFKQGRTWDGIPWETVLGTSFQGALDPQFSVSQKAVHGPQDRITC